MQKIFYRQVAPAWTPYNSNNWRFITPSAAEVEKLCSEFEAWAAANGFRVTSITPTTGTIVTGKDEFAVTMPHTAGLIFVCERPDAAQSAT